MTTTLRHRLSGASLKVALAAALFAGPAVATAGLTLVVPVQALAAGLDSATVGRWLDASEALEAWSQTLPEDRRSVIEETQDPSTMMGDISEGRMISRAVGRIADTPEAAVAEGIVAKHGFGSLGGWGEIGDQVMQAYVALNMEGEDMAGQRAEMDAARAEIMASTEMSAAQKKMMLDMLGSAGAMAEQAGQADPDDVAAVRPHLGRMERMYQGN